MKTKCPKCNKRVLKISCYSDGAKMFFHDLASGNCKGCFVNPKAFNWKSGFENQGRKIITPAEGRE